MAAQPAYVVGGVNKSYFTRKVTALLDYKGLPWQLARGRPWQPAAQAAGWPGGIPAVRKPDGEWMWDSTSVALHVEHCHPAAPAVVPDDPVLAFLQFVVEDMSDEWLYRLATGTRWYYEENTRHAGYELALDVSFGQYTGGAAASADAVHKMIAGFVRTTCPPGGFDADTRDAWVEEVLWPWLELLDAHFAAGHAFLLGGRPCLADFAIFGGHAAHFVTDPVCRRWAERKGPRNVDFTQRLQEGGGLFGGAALKGEWISAPKGPGDVPPTLLALLRDAGRLYLPWAAAACAAPAGEAVELRFASGTRRAIVATPFLRQARAELLARYSAARCPALDAILDAAGILRYFTGPPPTGAAPVALDASAVPRPPRNRGFPPQAGKPPRLHAVLEQQARSQRAAAGGKSRM